jgi:hypothetical protein
MRPADPICMWCALADADWPVRCDARLGLALQGPDYRRCWSCCSIIWFKAATALCARPSSRNITREKGCYRF